MSLSVATKEVKTIRQVFYRSKKKLSSSAKECQMIGKIFPLLSKKMSIKDVLCWGRYNLSFFFVSPVSLRHRNKDPTPFRHPVDVFHLFVQSGNSLPDIGDSLCRSAYLNV
jgi:hypothetical protein